MNLVVTGQVALGNKILQGGVKVWKHIIRIMGKEQLNNEKS